MPSQPILRMQSDLWIRLEFEEFFEVNRNSFIWRLVPGEGHDGTAPNTKAGILADHPQMVRYGIEIAASLCLASVASEGVGCPFANLRMLVVEAL